MDQTPGPLALGPASARSLVLGERPHSLSPITWNGTGPPSHSLSRPFIHPPARSLTTPDRNVCHRSSSQRGWGHRGSQAQAPLSLWGGPTGLGDTGTPELTQLPWNSGLLCGVSPPAGPALNLPKLLDLIPAPHQEPFGHQSCRVPGSEDGRIRSAPFLEGACPCVLAILTASNKFNINLHFQGNN